MRIQARSVRRISALSFLVALTCGSVDAQKQVGVGSVVDPAGQPAAGVTVHFVGRRLLLSGEPTPALRLRAITDERGRFRIELPERHHYAVHGVRASEDGSKHFTRRITEYAGHRPIRLQLEKKPRRAEKHRIQGVDAWKKGSPASIRVRLEGAEEIYHPGALPVAADGSFTLPALPGDVVHLELFDVAGRALETFAFEHGAAPERRSELVLGAPHATRFRVLDKVTEKPIAGAQIHQFFKNTPAGRNRHLGTRNPDTWHLLGRTDAAGELEVSLPRRHGQPAMRRYYARKAGYRNGAFGDSRWGDPDYTVEGGEDEKPDLFVVKMTEGPRVRGRVLGPDGKAIAGQILVHRDTATFYAGKRGTARNELQPRILRTDAEGRYLLEGVAPGSKIGLYVLVDPKQEREIAQSCAPFPPARFLPVWSGEFAADSNEEILAADVSLRQLRWLRVHLRRPSGRPVRDGHVLYGSPAGHAVRADCDSRGRVALPIQGEALEILAWDPAIGFRYRSVDVEELKDDQVCELVLDEFPVLAGRVRDKDGKPIPGARIVPRGSSVGGSVPSVVTQLRTQLPIVVTGEDGGFRVPYVTWPAYQYWMKGLLRVRGEELYTEQELRFPWKGGETAELEIALPGAK